MNLLFHIEYQTAFGEELVLNHVSANAGEREVTTYKMATIDGYHWSCEMKSVLKIGSAIDYFYSVVRGDEVVRREWTLETHRLELACASGVTYHVYDHWVDIPENAYLYSSAMTECVNRHAHAPVEKTEYGRTVRFKVRAPQLRHEERLALVGSDKVLGGWHLQKALPMAEHNYNEWIVDVDASHLAPSFEFKFVALDDDPDVAPLWERGENRKVTLPAMEEGDVVVYEFSEVHFDVYNLKCAGTLVPVFSLRSKDSFGVGDFGDLRKMVDWVAQTKQRVLQILPINDTTITHTWTDSYPYSCISIFAIHPQYADFKALPQLTDATQRKRFEKLRKELNALPQIDYERVNDAKNEYLRLLFEQEGKKTFQTAEYKHFFEENKKWLVPYAQYCMLRDTYGTADFSQWPDHQTWDEADRTALTNVRSKAYKAVALHYYVQFILYVQMKGVHEHARSKGVILKGDIPIGVNRHGCDVWQEPRYFNLNGQAGAPPDDFSANGQNWGFPTYNWDAMVADGCAWWVRRFSNMAKFFDAYRIDHVLGFFRIWEIPTHAVHGLLGQFSPALGMTREEIAAYGLHFQEQLFTEPFITDWVLDRMFGERADEVRQRYVEPIGDGRYRMRPEYATQRQVEAAFLGAEERDQWLRDGLYALISDVLFLRDHKDENKFHPRISVQFDFIYESLSDNDKQVFNRLYND